MYQNTYSKLINHFGGQNKTAKALDCSQPSVWKWEHGMGFMSVKLAKRAEVVTDGLFKAIDLCPDLAELEDTSDV